jgi:hypothetical protein
LCPSIEHAAGVTTPAEDGTMKTKTYETVGHALADPSSNIARFVETGKQRMAENARVIDALMAQGMTREEAWHHALFSATPLITAGGR